MNISTNIKYEVKIDFLQKLITQIGKKMAKEIDDMIIESMKGNVNEYK